MSALITAPPDDWTTLPASSAPIFVDDVSVEAGEILNGVALVLVGPRMAETLAYRILATLTASEKADSPDDQTFTWNVHWLSCRSSARPADAAGPGAPANCVFVFVFVFAQRTHSGWARSNCGSVA